MTSIRRRHFSSSAPTTRGANDVTPATQPKALCDYDVPPDHQYEYELDRLFRLRSAAPNFAANPLVQPLAEAEKKDRLEVEMQRRACVAFRTLAPADAAAVLAQEQREIAEDWPAAYRRYLPEKVTPRP